MLHGTAPPSTSPATLSYDTSSGYLKALRRACTTRSLCVRGYIIDSYSINKGLTSAEASIRTTSDTHNVESSHGLRDQERMHQVAQSRQGSMFPIIPTKWHHATLSFSLPMLCVTPLMKLDPTHTCNSSKNVNKRRVGDPPRGA